MIEWLVQFNKIFFLFNQSKVFNINNEIRLSKEIFWLRIFKIFHLKHILPKQLCIKGIKLIIIANFIWIIEFQKKVSNFNKIILWLPSSKKYIVWMILTDHTIFDELISNNQDLINNRILSIENAVL